jgi:hypothetical protein
MGTLFKCAAITFIAALFCLSLPGQSPYLERIKPVTISTDRQLFIDDIWVEAQSNVTRVMHQPVKEPAPVLVGDQPWENWAVDLFGPSIHYDPVQEIYRMWYTAYEVSGDDYYICYATSKDARHWAKPILGIEEYRGSKQNNIVNRGRVFWPNSSVIIDEHEADPGRRYKSLSWDFAPAEGSEGVATSRQRASGAEEHKKGRPLGISVAFSRDGLHWNLYDGNPVLKDTGDTHFIIGWDENYQKYVGYFRPSYAASGGPRVIGFSTSDDFIHWAPPEIILRPDSQDPISDELYGMPVKKYEGKYIGFLWVYHNSPNPDLVPKPNIENMKGSEQTLDTQLTYSEDGKHFIRVGNRQPFLTTGPPGSSDGGMVTISDMVVHKNEIWLYYGAWGARHNGHDMELMGKVVNGHRVMAALGMARLRLDGFVSLHAGGREGIVLVRQVLLRDQKHLRVNADASHGKVTAEILDENLNPLPGFTRADSETMREDSVSKEMTWRTHSDLSTLQGRAVRIRFYLQNADLYSMQLN